LSARSGLRLRLSARFALRARFQLLASLFETGVHFFFDSLIASLLHEHFVPLRIRKGREPAYGRRHIILAESEAKPKRADKPA
jgi:hypothetical protein